MKKINIEFEWLYLILVTGILTSMFYLSAESDYKNLIIQAFISLLSLVAGYKFGKTRPEK